MRFIPGTLRKQGLSLVTYKGCLMRYDLKGW
jgi:hypothetical protein